MLVIDLTGPESEGKTVDELIEPHSIDISREIIHAVCEAMDRGISKICAAQILIPGFVLDFTPSRSTYARALRTNIPYMILTEEYELCAKATKYLDKLNNQKLLVDSVK